LLNNCIFTKNIILYTFHRTQKLPITLEQAWDFFSDPKNLKTITPEYMGFDIIAGADRRMYPGQIIEYRVSPLLGIKTKWVTEITHVVPNEYFVDEQRFGPYTLWHHKHFFSAIENGVAMEDLIHYKAPMGALGSLFTPLIVTPKLEEIFNYRTQKLTEMFGSYS